MYFHFSNKNIPNNSHATGTIQVIFSRPLTKFMDQINSLTLSDSPGHWKPCKGYFKIISLHIYYSINYFIQKIDVNHPSTKLHCLPSFGYLVVSEKWHREKSHLSVTEPVTSMAQFDTPRISATLRYEKLGRNKCHAEPQNWRVTLTFDVQSYLYLSDKKFALTRELLVTVWCNGIKCYLVLWDEQQWT